jgi:putative methionine-R-sulfoxide reductase with GAF domain
MPMNAQAQNQAKETQQNYIDLHGWRAILARRLMRTMFFICIPAVLAASYYAIAEGDYNYIPIYIVIFLLMGIIAFWKSVPDNLRIIGLMILLYLVVLLDYATEGRGSLAPLFLATFAFSGALFFGQKGVIASLLIAILTMAAFAYAYISGLLPDFLVSSKVVPGWVSNSVMIVFIVAFISFSLNFVIVEITALVEKSQKLSQTLEAERSNLEKTLTERTEAAEIARAEAESARTEAENARRDVEAQMWMAIGQAQLAETMRGEQGIMPLSNRIIRFLCQHVGAQSGLLYVTQNEHLKLSGTYAVVEHPGLKEILRFGEGLVGQVVLQNEMKLLDDIPADTLVIASGLGDARPRQIVFIPISINGQTQGVIELATLTNFSNSNLAFLSSVEENIGIALSVAQTREQIATLVMENQRTASASKETLRASKKELQAQADSPKAKKKLRGGQHG